MGKIKFLFLFFWLVLFVPVFADTVYLKNGRSLEGMIVAEDDQAIELEVGFGTAKFEKTQIEKIYRGSPQEVAAMKQRWLDNKRLNDQRLKEVAARKELEPKEVDMMQQAGHVFLNVKINNKEDLNLILDTGASLVVLTSQAAKKLGLRYGGQNSPSVEMVLADGSRINAQYVLLDSLRTQDVEAKKIEAAVLPDTVNDPTLKDGLLGMSFLKNFSFKVDYKKNILTLEKLR